MHLNKILVLTDKKELSLPYRLLLQSYGEVDIEIISPKKNHQRLPNHYRRFWGKSAC